MPATYSILNGEITESTRKFDIYSVLQDLPDNTSKLISPRDVRDAFLTTWSSIAFKETTSNGNEYIGIDSSNPDERDIKKKILIGKRSIYGSNVLTDGLINSSDVDIFFYNTKKDSEQQDSTKISFLAGTASNLFSTAPFIESKKDSDYLSLNITNPQDSINFLSTNDRVSINNISFPTVLENQSSASEGKILKYVGSYPNGYLEWSDPFSSFNQIGNNDGSVTNIISGPSQSVFLNGFSLEFIENSEVPETIGGIESGMSFPIGSFPNSNSGNWPLSEVMRNLIYPYIEPKLTISTINSDSGNRYAEIGTTFSAFIEYKVITYAREDNEEISEIFLTDNPTLPWNVLDHRVGETSGNPGTEFEFNLSETRVASFTQSDTVDYTLFASNIQNPSDPNISSVGFSFSVTESVEFLSPILSSYKNFSSFDIFLPGDFSLFINDSDTIKQIDKILPGKKIEVCYNSATSSTIYFAHPNLSFEGGLTYSNTLKTIKDPNGYIIYDFNNPSLSSFTYSVVTPSSPLNYYGDYTVYKTDNVVEYNGGCEQKFEFIF